MLKKSGPQQSELEMVTIASLVPADHLLRKIDAAIDFTFIHERVAPLYCPDNGRPALDPVVLFKMLFIGYLFRQGYSEISWHFLTGYPQSATAGGGALPTAPSIRTSSTRSCCAQSKEGWWRGRSSTPTARI